MVQHCLVASLLLLLFLVRILLCFLCFFALWNQHNLEWYFNLLLWKGQQLVFNGYRMVACNLVPAAVTAVRRADLQHLVSGTHQCSRLLPPSQWTGRHLLLAQRRSFGEQMFSCCWVTGQDRRWLSREPGKGALRPAAPTPPPICLSCLTDFTNQSPRRVGFSVYCGLDCSVSFSLPVSLKAVVAMYWFMPQAFILPLSHARQFTKC